METSNKLIADEIRRVARMSKRQLIVELQLHGLTIAFPPLRAWSVDELQNVLVQRMQAKAREQVSS